jgi:ribonuclease R
LTKSRDTAIWLEKTDDGYTLLISIVDVGSFITASKTPMVDHEASIRALAHYTEEEVFAPLLPDSLAEGCLSLLQGQLCPTLTLAFQIDASFCVISGPSFQHTFVNNCKHFTYEEADQEMADTQAPYSSLLQEVCRTAVELWCQRVEKGVNADYDIQTGWVTTEDGVRILLPEEKRFLAYITVHEFRMLANQHIASYLAARDLPALYRNHPIPTIPSPKKAIYAPTREGHAGLQVPVYLHATSPLRNYASLVNQRILLAVLRGEPSPYAVPELEAIAHSLNAKQASIIAAKPAYFRSAYEKQLQQRLEEGSLESFTQKEFHGVLRKAAEEHALTPAIEQEIGRRLERSLLKDNDLFTLLFRFENSGEDWQRIKQSACSFLQHPPSYAGMVFHAGVQTGKWQPLDYDDQGKDVLGRFRARASLSCEGQEYASAVHVATRKDWAKYLAYAEILATIAGVTIPEPQQWNDGASGEKNVLGYPPARGYFDEVDPATWPYDGQWPDMI